MFSKPTKEPMKNLIRLDGKTAVITGSASGIGAAMAYRFAEAGADLVLVDLNQAGLEAVKTEAGGFGVDISIHRVDLADKAQIDGLWAELGDTSVLVNNAGIYSMRDFLELDTSLLEKVMDVNRHQALWMSQHFIRRNMGRGGAIVNVSSIETVMPFKDGMTHYAVSKSGVIALTRGLARDYGKHGFRVNVIIPGGIVTPGTISVAKELTKLKLGLIKDGLDFKARLPMGRAGAPDEVARVALVLASQASSYVTGALIPVDGGFLSS
ncbi:MAG: SDR family NAD(P)-dependent oxidoreductase [Candidatus Bathyarchaeota archaeon]